MSANRAQFDLTAVSDLVIFFYNIEETLPRDWRERLCREHPHDYSTDVIRQQLQNVHDLSEETERQWSKALKAEKWDENCATTG